MAAIKQARNTEVPKNLFGDGTKHLIQVKLQKAPNGSFGFNIVGGTDKQHLAGHSDIFVSRVHPGTPAARNGRLELGDIIVSVNGFDISAVSHDNATALFRLASICDMVVEKNGEQRILSGPPDFPDGAPVSAAVNEVAMKFFQDQDESSRIDKPSDFASGETNNVLSDDEKFYTPLNSPSSAKFSTRHQLLRSKQGSAKDEDSSNSLVKMESFEQKKVVRALSFLSDEQEEFARDDAVETLPSKVLGEGAKEIWHCKDQIEIEKEIIEGDRESDEQSFAKSSCSSDSVHPCFCEDLPLRAQKKQSPLDFLKRASLTNEVLFLSAGMAAMGAAAFVAYRWYKKH